MRWRIDLAYQGTQYSGWQKQPGDITVEQTLEEAFSMILREPIEITGCGRTDAGVHARKYTAHMDVSGDHDIIKTIYQVNSVLPHDIAVHSIREVDAQFHARYDATARQYKYYINFIKDPFLKNLSLYFNISAALRQDLMQDAAQMLLHYEEFLPFCKTGSDANHYRCILNQSEWGFTHGHAIYTVGANRFLRGMVRLIVGACLNIGLEKISLKDLEESLKSQSPLLLQWSVPPEGLFLENVMYPGD